MAANDREIALVKTKTGAFKMKVTDELPARVSRSDIASSELAQGALLAKLKIVFLNVLLGSSTFQNRPRSPLRGL